MRLSKFSKVGFAFASACLLSTSATAQGVGACDPSNDDGLEDNDDCLTAWPMGAGSTAGLFVSKTDEDFFAITVADGEIVTVVITFDPAVDTDLQLIDTADCTTVLDSSASVSGTETVSFTNSSGGAMVVAARAHVWSGASADCNNYDIEVTIDTPAGCGPDDGFEDNDDCLSAAAVTAGTHTGLHVDKADEDFYTISVPNGFNITAVITFDPAVDTDLQLIADDCSTVLDSSASVSGTETVTWANGTGAAVDVNIRAHVWSGASADCNDYDMDITVDGDPCQAATDDAFEDNDDCASAVAGPLGHIPGLFVSKTDPDYYSYHIPDGHTFDGTIQFIHANGDCDIFLWEVAACDTGAGGSLAFAWSTDDNEVLSWTNNTGAGVDAIFHVQVWSGSAQDCNDYDMINAITAPAPWNNYCGPSAVNSTGASATIWAAGTAEVIHNNFHLHAGGMPAGENMMFLSSMTQGSAAVGSGTLCLGGNIGRFRTSLQAVNGGGGAQHHVDLSHVPNGPGGQAALAGDTWNFQGWFRDGASSNFTDGLEVTFQ